MPVTANSPGCARSAGRKPMNSILTDGKLWAAVVTALITIAPVCEEPTRTILLQAAAILGVIASLIARPYRPAGARTRDGDQKKKP